MIFIALKWIEAGTAKAVVFVEIMARYLQATEHL